MKTISCSFIISIILLQFSGEVLAQAFPVDLESLKREENLWLDPHSKEGYNGAVYETEAGEIVFKGHLKNGWLHGRFEDYHLRSDSLGSKGYEKGSYENGQRNGEFEVYGTTGKLSEKGTYLMGLRHGPYSAYHDNSRLWIKTTYVEGNWEGSYESFDRTGILVAKGYYKTDFQCGLWIVKGKKVEFPSCK